MHRKYRKLVSAGLVLTMAGAMMLQGCGQKKETGKTEIELVQYKPEAVKSARDLRADVSIPCSARTGQGMEEFKEALLDILRREQIYIERLYGFDEAGKIQLIRKNGQLLSEEYKAEGIEVKAYVPKEIYAKV